MEVIFRHQQQVGQDFFTRLDTYLKGDRKKLKEVFELVSLGRLDAFRDSQPTSMANGPEARSDGPLQRLRLPWFAQPLDGEVQEQASHAYPRLPLSPLPAV